MRKVTLVPGDGIGPEISESVKAVLHAAGAKIEWDEIPVGQEALNKYGTMIPDAFVASMAKTGLALKGPTTTPIGGGHRSINVTMRQMFNLYASVRPVKNIDGITTPFHGVDLIIVRENTEDLYRGIEFKISDDCAQGIKLITREASERIVQYAFDLARRLKRRKVTTVHKANIMKLTDGLFLSCAKRIAGHYPEIEYNEMIIDNCCMQLVTKPEQFDVIVTENLYGDIISDLCAGLVGGLGLAPGANIGLDKSIFEAAHGSAPDIAGRDLANPTALLLSGVMLLEHVGEMSVAQKVKNATFKALARKETRTRDLGGALKCSEFTKKIIDCL